MRRLQTLSGHVAPSSYSQSAHGGARPKVALLGAAGGIGQPLALMLKMCPLVKELALYDVMNTAGVAADLSHIDSAARVTAFTGDRELGGALYGADLVIIPAGVPRKPGMTRDDLFKVNAGIVKKLCEAVTRFCPEAWVAVISNPVNSTVPIAAEVFKRAGCFNPARLFGVTTLDVVRANTFVAEVLNADARTVEVPVVGGHAGKTILPLLSLARPRPSLSAEQLQALTLRIQNAGTEVVEAKAGAGSATLSMAYAAHRFAESCLKAMAGQVVEECAFVANTQSGALPDVAFFAAPLQLGPSGLQKVALPPSCLSQAEQMGLQSMLPELQASIDKGIRFATQTS